MKNKRIIITLPESLRNALRKASEKENCSQAEIIRGILYRNLDYIGGEENES